MLSLLSIQASNFLSLGNVDVQLRELSVLVGPNGAGKSNLLNVIKFLGDTARLDLIPAINENGGMKRLMFRGLRGEGKSNAIRLGIKALITDNASERAPDEYALTVWQQNFATAKRRHIIIQRREEFIFKRVRGAGRRITVYGAKAELVTSDAGVAAKKGNEVSLSSTSSGLSTLPRLKGNGAEQINSLAELFTTFRVFEIDCAKARTASKYDSNLGPPTLRSDAGNLAAFLVWLKNDHPESFSLLEDDLRTIVPSINSINFSIVGGVDSTSHAISFTEKGLSGDTELADASFGTVRSLALLAMLHDPNPPKLTCVEEIDHGLHPHALDRIVERLRTASRRTQLLVVTHSPALANRLEPEELIVCERSPETGASLIPAVPSNVVRQMADASSLLPGELWFSGVLGGGLE